MPRILAQQCTRMSYSAVYRRCPLQHWAAQAFQAGHIALLVPRVHLQRQMPLFTRPIS